MVLNDESKYCIGIGDDRGKFIWRLQLKWRVKIAEIFYLKFRNLIRILGCMFSKRAERLCVVNGNRDSEKYVSFSENFLIPSLQERLEDSSVINMVDNTL